MFTNCASTFTLWERLSTLKQGVIYTFDYEEFVLFCGVLDIVIYSIMSTYERCLVHHWQLCFAFHLNDFECIFDVIHLCVYVVLHSTWFPQRTSSCHYYSRLFSTMKIGIFCFWYRVQKWSWIVNIRLSIIYLLCACPPLTQH